MLTPDEESRRIRSAANALLQEFPEVSPEQIEVLVDRIWAEFLPARIRDFVPVLVGAAVRDRLRSSAARSA